MDRNAAPEGSRWFERSEHHWRSQRPSKSPPPAGAHLDLRSLRDHRAFGSVFRRCAAARRPPATILNPFGILAPGTTVPTSQQPMDRGAAPEGSRWFERSEHHRKTQRSSNHRPRRGRTSICDPSGITARLGRYSGGAPLRDDLRLPFCIPSGSSHRTQLHQRPSSPRTAKRP
ncbi:hypothetical protein Mal33_24490 [Rosistilla oblonga]|uniref:Uncharacterized protein n=1 Tax=Rosistilla oblonga TaxID=2527990 RepID=A0A518ITP0_9BACT|nr:hypothetical protein Mal33_24490 [Rosistilla oblonga]